MGVVEKRGTKTLKQAAAAKKREFDIIFRGESRMYAAAVNVSRYEWREASN